MVGEALAHIAKRVVLLLREATYSGKTWDLLDAAVTVLLLTAVLTALNPAGFVSGLCMLNLLAGSSLGALCMNSE